MHSVAVIKAVAVTAELCGRTFSEAAAGVFCADLGAYPEAQVLHALARCRREVKGALTTADVITRMDDGRPGVEEAWAQIPQDEAATVIWTAEAAAAYGACAPLIAAGDRIAARMAFKEVYLASVAKARDAGEPVTRSASLGSDLEGRKRVLAAAVQAGQLTPELAFEACPLLPPPKSLLLDAPPKTERAVAKVKREISELAAAMRDGEPADPLAWAKDLRTRERGGLPLNEAQRQAWRQAIDRVPSDQMPTGFTPIPNEALPPGMRKGAKP